MKFGAVKSADVGKSFKVSNSKVFRKALHKTWEEFTRVTSIHGLKYTMQSDVNFVLK